MMNAGDMMRQMREQYKLAEQKRVKEQQTKLRGFTWKRPNMNGFGCSSVVTLATTSGSIDYFNHQTEWEWARVL